ncbi:MAG: tetratricopeptide repeat protein [Actinomycetota bacterium]
MTMDPVESRETDLRERLFRYPSDRYPVQHAVARFHLGVVLTDAGRYDEAEEALAVAARLFDPHILPTEHGKAMNALGAALRAQGRLDDATVAFQEAVRRFEAAEAHLELGAALFNLALTCNDAEGPERALGSIERARRLLDDKVVPGQAAAAAREHGAMLFRQGDLEGACEALEDAVALSERTSDAASLGAAQNVLGLVYLGQGRTARAVDALSAAAAAGPRTIRPQAYALAKANLALAYERVGDAPRARLAARQALAVDEAAEPVVAQAAAVLQREGSPVGDLARLFGDGTSAAHAAAVREELTRWLAEGSDVARSELRAWAGAEADRSDGTEMAEALLGGFLEQPPDEMERLIRALLEATAALQDATAQRFRSQVSRAMVRFHVPQWIRLKDTFNRIAADLGTDASWG